jgi:hypothetical protein
LADWGCVFSGLTERPLILFVFFLVLCGGQWAVESTHSWVSPNPDPPENQDDLLQNPLENHHDSPQIRF